MQASGSQQPGADISKDSSGFQADGSGSLLISKQRSMTANQPQQDANDKASASGVHPGTSGSGKNTVSYEAKFLKKIFSKLNQQKIRKKAGRKVGSFPFLM